MGSRPFSGARARECSAKLSMKLPDNYIGVYLWVWMYLGWRIKFGGRVPPGADKIILNFITQPDFENKYRRMFGL